MEEAASYTLVMFRIEGQRYALPLPAVGRALPMVAVAPLPDAPAVVLGVVNVRGEVLPVIDLRRRLGARPREWSLEARLLMVRSARRSMLLPVDEVLGILDVDAAAVTAAQELLPGVHQVKGVVALRDGVLFIQDLDALLALDEERALTRALEAAPR